MERFVAQHNISHFEELLSNETDPNERRILEMMLREERARLVVAEAHPHAAAKYSLVPGADHVTC